MLAFTTRTLNGAVLMAMEFIHQAGPKAALTEEAPLVLLQGTRLLLRNTPEGPALPVQADVNWTQPLMPLGLLDGRPCWAASVSEQDASDLEGEGLSWQELRPVTPLLDPCVWQAVACARELHWWHKGHQFCGCCGSPMRDSERERARVCTACNHTVYPVVSPAVIVAITRGDELLLAHNRNFRPGLHSLIAGFVDPGETPEQCVAREAMEEIGIRITDIRYRGSQPWPYPASLMLGFSARYDSGEIRVDGEEIHEAAWFRKNALPEIPGPGTVARHLIDAWLRGEF